MGVADENATGPAEMPTSTSPVVGPSKPRFLRALGPGLITGASDDDPSGIGTYSQAGAQLGFAVSWTMLVTYPLMAAIQEISGRVGRTTGRGIAGIVCRHYPNWLLQSIVTLLFIANTINIGADLGAMADALKLLIGGPHLVYVVLFGVICVVTQILLQYTRYIAALKWLTLSLFTYVAALFAVHTPWGDALKGLLVPHVQLSSDFTTTLVAILGTTISPYLFFWQAAQEAEDTRVKPERTPLRWARRQAPIALARIRADTLAGMAFSNLIAVAIIITTAATLNSNGITNVETSAQAAEALKPIAGEFASLIFTLGIVGTGLLAVPVLAGSAAYAVGESRRWPTGLSREPREAWAFYSTLGIATALGVLMNFTSLNPIRALYWSAVINGVVAVPVMIILMLMTRRNEIMGQFTITGWLSWLGWAATVAMAACVAGMVIGWFG
jgi:NRAMP (natural resistance-associated macrophage protein)-like metal ion transporter